MAWQISIERRSQSDQATPNHYAGHELHLSKDYKHCVAQDTCACMPRCLVLVSAAAKPLAFNHRISALLRGFLPGFHCFLEIIILTV